MSPSTLAGGVRGGRSRRGRRRRHRRRRRRRRASARTPATARSLRDGSISTGTVVRFSHSPQELTLAADGVRRTASFAEHVCLALVSQRAPHGWALGTHARPDGEVGRIWTLTRPLTYRAIDRLADKRLLASHRPAAGRGRDQLLRLTPVGAVWTKRGSTPVEHLRDVRTELLLKLELALRAGPRQPPLLAEQQQPVRRAIDASPPASADARPRRPVASRAARAVRRFLDAGLGRPPRTAPPDAAPERPQPAQRHGTDVHHGEVMSTVKADARRRSSASRPRSPRSRADLDLAHGDEVVVIVKSTEVIVCNRHRLHGPNNGQRDGFTASLGRHEPVESPPSFRIWRASSASLLRT